ncbi:MAG: cytochrome c oxidase subunit II [Acidobacteria bacterium]|nr:cytochrome c oxidase subunit II [Acidobacteriota bacterium]MCA1609815.1 cytochrome c oxidase subunit II [Acidobacteriota bacterium]
MRPDLPLFPSQASAMAPHVDALYFYLLAVSAFFSLLIAILVIFFAIKFRRRSEDEVPVGNEGSLKLELAWTVIPLLITMTFFVWGAKLYFRMNRPPNDATQIFIVGKQWMWKLQHQDGQREINELHVPVGTPVRLTMTSEDVIHSFFIPAFRMKMDVIPGRYTQQWFRATTPGDFHIFCSQYCGTKHSAMIGTVHVMEPTAFQAWLSGGSGSESLASAGSKLFQQHACNTCHRNDSQARGPNLEGLFGKPVQLQNGQTVTADEQYIRESILMPSAKMVAGYQPIMPTFQGLISEEGILQLVAYIRSLSPSPGSAAAPSPGGMAPPVKNSSPEREAPK